MIGPWSLHTANDTWWTLLLFHCALAVYHAYALVLIIGMSFALHKLSCTNCHLHLKGALHALEH